MSTTKEILNDKQLLNNYILQAKRYAFKVGRADVSDPEDLVQSAMIKLLQRPKDDEAPTGAWIFRTVSSAAFDAGRNRQRICTYTAQDIAHTVSEDSVDSDAAIYSASVPDVQTEIEPYLLPAIKSALASLSEPLRQTLLLHAFDYTYEEISTLTNVPIGTVRSRLHHARIQCRKRLRYYE